MCSKGLSRRAGCACPGTKMERFLEPCLLLLLAEGQSHGYELMDTLGCGSLLEDSPDPGLMYRTLRRLEENEFVASTWETGGSGPAKRLYNLTPAGFEYLSAWAANIQRNRERLDRFLGKYAKLVEKKGGGVEGV